MKRGGAARPTAPDGPWWCGRVALVAAGLLVPTTGPLAAADPGEGGRQERAEREVTFRGVGGVRLAGTLLLPDRERGARAPGVLLVQGSGPTDRDGNSAVLKAKIDLLKQLAEILAGAGIASLRYDKRGQFKSQKAPAGREAFSNFCAWENYAGDAAAALGFLQRQPEIDPGRTAMVGHSEGGALVLVAATGGEGFREAPVALVLLSAPGRPLDVILREQLARSIATLVHLKRNDEIVAAIKETGTIPKDVPAALRPVYPPGFGRFAQGMFRFDGPALAARFPGPVLVVSGAKDVQHKVKLETAALAAGLKRRDPDEHEVFIVPRASHNLKPATFFNPNGYSGALAPAAADKIRGWLAEKLAPPAKAAAD